MCLPAICGLFLVLFSFKFALLADINQGCIPSLFAVTSIYIAIVFYFCFKEPLSGDKIIGIGLIVICIVLLATDKKDTDGGSDAGDALTVQEKHRYGILAILFAIIAPFFWTFRAYSIRRTLEAKVYKISDLGIDANMATGLLLTLFHVAY